MLQPFAVGDTLKHRVALADYPAGDGWVLHFRLTPRETGGTARSFDAVADGDEHLATVSATTTATWSAGVYTVSAWVTKADERYTIPSEGGQVTLAPNSASLPVGTDTRTQLEIALDNVRAMLRGKASSAVQRYRINNRELQYYSLDELMRLETRLATQVASEQAAAGKTPAGGSRRILVSLK
jgi:hypothetical protein